MQWFGKPVVQNRMLGQVDQDDSTVLPVGLASLVRNFEWTRDAPGPTCATTRAGINAQMRLVDKMNPATGLLGFAYSPESAIDPFFQMPLAFQPTVGSQYESPVGSGNMVKFPQTNFTEPQGAHAIQAAGANKVFSAYSDLRKPLATLSTMDPKALTLNPFGMKPVGFNWVPNQAVLQMEAVTPSSPNTGNGHTYQAQNAGVTGAVEPIWPLTEGGEVIDNPGANQIVWKEKTMVIANRIPPPVKPVISLSSGGTIASDKDVYIVITLTNLIGETLPSVPEFVTTIADDSSVEVQLPTLASMPAWIRNLPANYVPTGAKVYVAIVTHGAPAPALSTYNQVTGISTALGATVFVTAAGSGAAPPNFCSARVTPGQLPIPTTEPQIQRVVAGSVVQPPGPPGLSLVNGAGSSFTAGQVISVALTLVNGAGETTLGGIANIEIGIDGQGIEVSLAASYGPTVTGVKIWASLNAFSAGDGSVEAGSPFPVGSSTVLTAFGPGSDIPASNTAVLPTGSFPAGRDVYVAMTYTNAQGETPLGPPNSVIDTNADDAVLVTVAVPLGPQNEQLYTISSVGIYEADVPTGTAAPVPSAFSLVGYYQPLATPFILETATGPNPPLTNTTGTGGAIVADTMFGGPNGTQGYRYAAMGWINQMETFSGFSEASVVSTIIDEDGWEIGVFNILEGPPNIVGRYIAFTIADGSQAGPFAYIGNVNLQVPTANFVYPTQVLVDLVEQSATVFLDNVTTQGVFNFTDSYLTGAESEYGNNVDDRLDIAIPPTGVRVDFLESVSRLVVSGVPGYQSGCWISLANDFESFYADDSPVEISSQGDVCYGVTDQYKGIIFALMKSGGFVLSANTGDPDSWAANRRWGGIDPAQQLGPCGFRAWCACGKFIIFAHRSGLYKYDMSDPDMMSKEVPKAWSRINWAAGKYISVTIDEDTHTVRVLVPTGASMVPNEEMSLSYIEGWNNPIHFSTFSGREISMDAARRWSFNDVSAFLCLRMERTLPPGGNAYLDGPSFETMPDSSFGLTQLLYASSNYDGLINARTPGIFSDNGGYIDWQYETMSSGLMQAVCKPEGMNLNACGYGIMIPSFIASRAMETDEGGQQKVVQLEEEVLMEPVALQPKQIAGITRKCASAINEFWRLRFANNKQPGSWISLKAVTPYMIPVTPGRDQ